MAEADRRKYVEKICASKKFDLSKEQDQRHLKFLADELLKGHRGDDILLHEDTYNPRLKECQEIAYDFSGSGEWDVALFMGSPTLALNYDEEVNP